MTPADVTPGSKWRAEGLPDPHGTKYDCERAQLPKGKLTDDELANAVFMADRNDLDLIVWQTAAKERIRWLSRSLAAQTARADAAEEREAALLATNETERQTLIRHNAAHAAQVADLTAKLEAMMEAETWQIKQRIDAMARRHMNAPEDPQVRAICERYGYCAVMDAASRLWTRKDSLGAFYIGGCVGFISDDEARAALKAGGAA